MSDPADRGKEAEKAVQKFLTAYSAGVAKFDWERLPDAKSAMGRVKAQAADFAFFMPARHGLIEVKETEHSHRLAKDKFPQLPRMRKRHLAGGTCLLVVHHSVQDAWRWVDISVLDPAAKSWDLSSLPTYPSAEEALYSIGVFR
jgi:hypothetical protein